MSVTFTFVDTRVNLIMKVELYYENLENGQCVKKSKDLHNLANECTSLGIKVLVKSQDVKDILKEFKEYFVEKLSKVF